MTSGVPPDVASLRSKCDTILSSLRHITEDDEGLSDEQFDEWCDLFTDMRLWDIDTHDEKHDLLASLEQDTTMSELKQLLEQHLDSMMVAVVSQRDVQSSQRALYTLSTLTNGISDYAETIIGGYLSEKVRELSAMKPEYGTNEQPDVLKPILDSITAIRIGDQSEDGSGLGPVDSAAHENVMSTSLDIAAAPVSLPSSTSPSPPPSPQPSTSQPSQPRSVFSHTPVDSSVDTSSTQAVTLYGDTASQKRAPSVPDPHSSIVKLDRNRPHLPDTSENPPDPYQCLHVGCNSAFSRAQDLQRHYQTVHRGRGSPLLECPYKWCGRTGDRGFTRQDHYRDHLREVHQEDLPRKR